VAIHLEQLKDAIFNNSTTKPIKNSDLILTIITIFLFRLWNEENKDYEIKRAQIYMLQGFVISSYVLGVKTIVTTLYQQMITRTRYIRDSYKEIDISELPPGEVLQTSWNGELIFVRRLTVSEVKDTNALPASTLLDKVSVTSLSVYDKFGRVRQGPAQANLPYINNSVYGPVVCIEEQ
jgi:hypothetical protein